MQYLVQITALRQFNPVSQYRFQKGHYLLSLRSQSVSGLCLETLEKVVTPGATVLDFDKLIVANIVADIIMQFNPQVAQFLKPGGTYITGGIIDVREDEVLASFAANGFTVQQRFEDKGWLVFVLKHE